MRTFPHTSVGPTKPNAHGSCLMPMPLPFWTLYMVRHDSPQTKITKFITAAKHRFARSPTRGKKSKKQTNKVIHIPGESFSKQKDTATNRKSCQPAPTSCRDRSPTPHPFSRGKADTREECQPTSNSHRARSPTPPWRRRNANTWTFSQSINHSFHIDTIQLHHSSPHSTESHSLKTTKSSLQDLPRCIPRPSTRKHVNSSRVPIPSKLRCHNLASSHKNKPHRLLHTSSPWQEETHVKVHSKGQC